jgi:hypothetical protein
MKKTFCYFLTCAVAISFLPGCASYPEYGSVDVRSKDVRVKVEFTDHDRRIIHDYYKKKPPPGLAKKKHLPPGLQKHVAKNGKLPPGLEKRNLPSELERRLSPIPAGYARVTVGNDIALMYVATQVIVDIIHDAY